MWELDHKESWEPKNWCFWTVVLEKTPESPLDSKEIKPVSPKGNQPWTFIGRTDAEAKSPILWPPDVKKKTLMLGKIEGRGRGDVRGWDGWLASPTWWTWVWASYRIGNGQESLACCSPWGCKSQTWLSNSATTTKAAMNICMKEFQMSCELNVEICFILINT